MQSNEEIAKPALKYNFIFVCKQLNCTLPHPLRGGAGKSRNLKKVGRITKPDAAVVFRRFRRLLKRAMALKVKDENVTKSIIRKQSSKFSLTLRLAIAAAFTFSAPTQASLTSYTGADGAGLVYSSETNVTWTQDANLFKTMYAANNRLISLITAVTPTYNDPTGLQVIGDGAVFEDYDDFDTSTGKLSWFGALAFTNYLNSISYGGSNQWRLPLSSSKWDEASPPGSELGILFYSELLGQVGSDIPDSHTFNNEQAWAYWTGTQYEDELYRAWYFNTTNGRQHWNGKANQYYAWAVSPGQVSTVPLPGAAWLMLTGMFGVLGLKKRRRPTKSA